MLRAVAHYDLGGAIIELVVGRQFFGNRLTQFRNARARRIFRKAGFQRGDRCRFDVLRRIEIRFARAETADIDSLGFHRFRFAVDRKRERRSQLSGARGNFHVDVMSLQFKERTLLATVEVFNQRFEIVLAHLDDRHLALGIFHRIGGMRGVDHDGLSKFLSN